MGLPLLLKNPRLRAEANRDRNRAAGRFPSGSVGPAPIARLSRAGADLDQCPGVIQAGFPPILGIQTKGPQPRPPYYEAESDEMPHVA